MKVLCRKVISRATGEELDDSNPFLTLKKSKIYVVLAINYYEGTGIDIFIRTEDHNDSRFVSLSGFEIIDQKIPSSWITVFSESYGLKCMTIFPASWNYESFFEDLDDQEPKAINLYCEEVEKIYKEMGVELEIDIKDEKK